MAHLSFPFNRKEVLGMKKILLPVLTVTLLFFAACASVQTGQPDMSKFVAPTIKLEMFEVPQYDGYWFYGKDVKPTKGDPGDRGAPLPISFLFSIKNDNPYPITLEGITFTVAFDKDFDVVTVNNQDTYQIPANSVDQVRLVTMITAQSARLSLLATGGFKLKAKNMDAWAALEKWWKGVPDLSVPVSVKEGAFTFKVGKETKVVPFKADLP